MVTDAVTVHMTQPRHSYKHAAFKGPAVRHLMRSLAFCQSHGVDKASEALISGVASLDLKHMPYAYCTSMTKRPDATGKSSSSL
jgi:hypothetical protein